MGYGLWVMFGNLVRFITHSPSPIIHRPSFIFLFACLLLNPSPIPAQEEAYSCILHVHSKMSHSGRYSLPELTETARGYGVDAIFLTDNLTDTIEYGIWPLRHVLWLNYTRNSVMTTGPEAYLDRIAAENRRQSDVLYVPGVEICPRFYWSGTLTAGDLTCHDHQRNLIVLGISKAETLKKISEACGYVWRKDPGWILASRLLVVLFAATCLAMFTVPRFLARRSPYSSREIRRSLALGVLMPLFILAVALNIAASLAPSFRIYGRNDSADHEQSVIDFLVKHNLAHYWAHPEASDHHEFKKIPVHNLKYFPFKSVRVPFKAHTDPYPAMLSLTRNYTGFGGVYEDRNTLTDPGSVWDRVLNEYIEGKRKVPAWCFGEMLYHYEGQAGKKLGNVETMVWASERSAEALLESLRKGRFYARSNADDQSLVLDEWNVRKTEHGGVEVVLRVSSRIPENKVLVQLIRNGEVIKEFSGETPAEIRYVDDTPEGPSVYYRAVVRGRAPLKLVTNPMFILRGTR